MKKLLSLLGISLLALVLAVPAFAADKPIQVYVNGSSVAFTAGSPYLKNNSVLVPFRVIFEKLGLTVLWDAKAGTVTGTSPSLTISLKIGSNRATVNGLVRKLAAAPVSNAGTTYIPLRFVAEATGGTAVWDAASRSVKITSPVSSSNNEQDISALIHLSNQYLDSKDAEGYFSLIASGSEVTDLVDNMKEYFKAYDMINTIESLDVLSIQGDEAIVQTVETSVRKSGRYLPDQRLEYLHTLVKSSGVWKIASSEIQDSSILLTREQGMTAAVLPETDASAIKSSLSKYYAARNAKDTEGTLAQLTYYGEEYEASMKDALDEYFADYNVTDTLANSSVFYYTADEAAVYVESAVKNTDTEESYTQSLVIILSKSDTGSWTIDDTYLVAYSDEQ